MGIPRTDPACHGSRPPPVAMTPAAPITAAVGLASRRCLEIQTQAQSMSRQRRAPWSPWLAHRESGGRVQYPGARTNNETIVNGTAKAAVASARNEFRWSVRRQPDLALSEKAAAA